MICDFFDRHSVRRNPSPPCCKAGVFTICVQVSGLSDVEPWGGMGAHGRLDLGTGVRQWAVQEQGAAGPLL